MERVQKLPQIQGIYLCPTSRALHDYTTLSVRDARGMQNVSQNCCLGHYYLGPFPLSVPGLVLQSSLPELCRYPYIQRFVFDKCSKIFETNATGTARPSHNPLCQSANIPRYAYSRMKMRSNILSAFYAAKSSTLRNSRTLKSTAPRYPKRMQMPEVAVSDILRGLGQKRPRNAPVFVR